MASAPIDPTEPAVAAATAPGGRAWPVVVLALAAMAILLIWPAVLLRDGDTGWHLGAGDFIWRTRTIPAVDPFSFTFRGQPWTAHEWLSELLMSGAFRVGGWNGLTVLFALAAAGTLLLIGRELLRWLPPRWAAVGVLVVGFVGVPLTVARPHLFAWALFAGWLIILLRAREQRRAPPWIALALMTLWANLHASYILGIGVAGIFTVEALIDHRHEPRLALRWALWGLLAIAATALTPHGLQGFLYPFQVRDMKVLAIIDEWRPADLRDTPFLLYAALFWLFLATRWRQVSPLRLLLLGGLFVMTLLHVRDQILFAIAGALIAAPLAGSGQHDARLPWRTIVPVLGLLALVRMMVPWSLPNSPVFPLALIDRLPASLKAQPVLNDYSMGGPLIMRGIAPAIDGRADMYGDDFTFAHLAMQRGDMAKFRAFVQRWNVGWTILTRDSPLAKKLDHEPGWRRLAWDANAVVHVRTR
ncbi:MULTISPECIES: hypothetical protein [Sphingomonas]|uniref:hypothetical protein n=1 Tax=Sphingomonas TaxID=13687 RepID=UPI000DF0017D|nr:MULTISPECIES: hypothetical protein [Sphingomonas]